MTDIPQTRDWVAPIRRRIDNFILKEDEHLKFIRLCEETGSEIEAVYSFVRDQREIVAQLLNEYRRIYFTLYNKDAPTHTREELQSSEEILDSPERRKNEVRMLSVELAAPGQEITDEQVLDALKDSGKRLIADNPRATISTILWGFKSEFEKVPKKRSTFRRLEAPQENS